MNLTPENATDAPTTSVANVLPVLDHEWLDVFRVTLEFAALVPALTAWDVLIVFTAVSMLTPLFGVAFMVRLHRQLAPPEVEALPNPAPPRVTAQR